MYTFLTYNAEAPLCTATKLTKQKTV